MRHATYWLFGVALVVVGVAALTFTNATNSLVQLATTPAMRGRVTAIRLAIAPGGTPVGAPLVGWVADRYGPRWSLAVGGASGNRRGGRCRVLPGALPAPAHRVARGSSSARVPARNRQFSTW